MPEYTVTGGRVTVVVAERTVDSMTVLGAAVYVMVVLTGSKAVMVIVGVSGARLS